MQKKTGRAGQFRAIEGISGQRVPRGGEMRPDLVARALADAAADEHERGIGIIGWALRGLASAPAPAVAATWSS